MVVERYPDCRVVASTAEVPSRSMRAVVRNTPNAMAVAPSVAHLAVIPRAELSDAALVAEALSGKGWAEEMLYRRHVHAVSQTVASLLGRVHECEDVVQDTFVQALSQLSSLREPAAFRGWLLRISVHTCHRRFRRRRLLRALGLDRGAEDATLAQLVAPGVSAEHRSELTRVDAALRPLPARERSAWILRHVHGHELTEVADLSGVSLATAKRLLTRAQERVAAHVHAVTPAGGKRAEGDQHD